jgi:hypothetical protein
MEKKKFQSLMVLYRWVSLYDSWCGGSMLPKSPKDVSSCTWEQGFEELHIKIPWTSYNPVCGA